MSKSEEVKLLESMSKERDETIAKLEGRILDQDEEMFKVRNDLRSTAGDMRESETQHEERCRTLATNRAEVDREMLDLSREMTESRALHDYVNLLNGNGRGNVESLYVTRIQAKLCRSMHCLGMLGNQMIIVRKTCDASVKSMRGEISSLIDAKCEMEFDIMNELAKIDSDRVASEDEWKERLRRERAAVRELEGKPRTIPEDDDDDGAESGRSEEDGSEPSDGVVESVCSEDGSETSDGGMEDEIESLRERLALMRADRESTEKELGRVLEVKEATLKKMGEERSQKAALGNGLELDDRENTIEGFQ